MAKRKKRKPSKTLSDLKARSEVLRQRKEERDSAALMKASEEEVRLAMTASNEDKMNQKLRLAAILGAYAAMSGTRTPRTRRW